MGHTPGPWEVRELLPDGAIIRHPGTYEIRTHGYDVATYIRAAGPFRKREDAELAAAAPDLLAVLEAVEWVADPDDPKRVYCPWCGNYRKPYGHSPECEREIAIAKAKGENHERPVDP